MRRGELAVAAFAGLTAASCGGDGDDYDSSDVGNDGGETIACGPSLTCDSTSVCIVEDNQPTCTQVSWTSNDAGTCAEEQTLTTCPLPYDFSTCCCGSAPPSEYRCAKPKCEQKECHCLCNAGQTCLILSTEVHCRGTWP